MKLVGVYSSGHETFKDEWFCAHDAAGNVTETPNTRGEFKEPRVFPRITSGFPLKGISHDSAFIG
jgi:hypothetical protein